MFWRFGGYANISTIDTLLDKPDVTLEELLDESDLIQELKSHNTKLIEFLREDPALQKLLEYVVAPKLEPVISGDDEDDQDKGEDLKGKDREADGSISGSHTGVGESDEKEKKRNRYAYVAAEILSSDSWSLSAALLENQALLRKFWAFLKLPIPLDPLQASYFTKVNEALLDKKTEEMLDLFKSLDNVVHNMLQHVDSPMVMDLLLKIISLEKAEGGQGIVDWLHSQNLMPILLSFLSAEHSWATQTSAGDFLKAIITISANASQNEQSCIGPNELTRQLVSEGCVGKLIRDMLKGGNPLTVGVGIVIEVIRKNNSDYDPDVGAEANTAPSSRDPIYLGTLLRMFANHIPDFMELILSPNHTIGGGDGPVTIRRKELSAAFGSKIEPLGFDRFKTCELMAELLHCSNMGLLNEPGSEDFVKARDRERERLKEEGGVKMPGHNRQDSTSEDLTMKSSTSRPESDSPDEMRRLEIQNASDADGFEEVTHSGHLGDDSTDDFEKSEMIDDFLTPTKPDSSISFLDKDDEDFVDEPLSSPRLKADKELFRPDNTPDGSLNVMPLSPTRELSQQVGGLHVDEDTTMTSPPSDIHSDITESTLPSISSDKHSLEALEDFVDNHPLGVLESISDVTTPALQIPLSPAPPEGGLSPHPEDKPAPLFAKRSEVSGENMKAHDAHIPASDTSSVSGITDITDTTMADAGDGSNSILMSNMEGQSGTMFEEVQPPPVVGDFLKMQFVEHRVVPTILDFFFRFPWNNFLHNVVYDVVQQVFNGPMDRGYNRALAIDLFDTGDVTMRIVDGQKRSDEAQESNRMRLGYMGHLTLIAEEVVKFTERHPPELLSESVLEKVMNSEWITYVEVTLAETRERDNAILGGVRPDMSVGPRQAVMNAVNNATGFGGVGSSALADAGLNGSASLDGMDLANGSNTSSGSFAISGSLLSGFGSSSDEDDEEMDEDNEEDGLRGFNPSGAEFNRYLTNAATTTASSGIGPDLDPPMVPPPPPPPLNIPPSRARRQLAARLALHSKQAAENALSSNGNQAEPEKSEHKKNPNPFATEEDDDEDGREDFTLGDIEIAAEGKGILPPATVLTGQQVPLGDLSKDLEDGKGRNDHVGNSKSNISTRATFPSMWPFGQSHRSGQDTENSASYHEKSQEKEMERSSDDSGSDDDSDDEFGSSAGIAGATGKSGRRRLSTTEAKRRTSLEDDDEEEVVHVGRSTTGDDEELIEIQHAEMQGIEGFGHIS